MTDPTTSGSGAPGSVPRPGESAPPPLVMVVSGPGGVGKGTVVAALAAARSEVWVSRSWTTREPRPGEPLDAYVFTTREEFEAHVEADGFLEWAEFLGNLYGTPLPAPPTGTVAAILEIDVQGAAQVRERIPDAALVFIEAPSAEDHETRLRGRGDPDDKVAARLDVTERERAMAAELGCTVIVNHDVDATALELWQLITTLAAG